MIVSFHMGTNCCFWGEDRRFWALAARTPPSAMQQVIDPNHQFMEN